MTFRPSFDTGEDAIVRVTASDVRRLLRQHYRTCGSSCEFRIRLPLRGNGALCGGEGREL